MNSGSFYLKSEQYGEVKLSKLLATLLQAERQLYLASEDRDMLSVV